MWVKTASRKAEMILFAVKTVMDFWILEQPAEKKSPAKAAKKEAEQEMILQFGGREIKEKDLYERIQQIWIEGYGKKAEELKSLKVYVKPEEFTAYYVINDDVTGSIDL